MEDWMIILENNEMLTHRTCLHDSEADASESQANLEDILTGFIYNKQRQ